MANDISAPLDNPDNPDHREPGPDDGNGGPRAGAYRLWVANAKGDLIDPSTAGNSGVEPNPEHPEAVNIYFGLLDSSQPAPEDQRALHANIDQVLRVCRERYMQAKPARFRNLFIRLFHLARRGLEGAGARPDLAMHELKAIAAELDAARDQGVQPQAASPPTPGAPVPPAPAPAAPPPRGAYRIWVTNADGDLIDRPGDDPNALPDPNNVLAVDLYFGLLEVPPKEQFALHLEIDKVLRACQRLYLKPGEQPAPKFRIYFTRLFHIAQLGLEGERPLPDVAAIGLASISSDLLDDEGATIKNGYLKKLGLHACLYAGIAMFLYLLLRLLPASFVRPVLTSLNVNLELLSCFLLLWTGCFVGVWLSYGIRKTKLSLIDLTGGEADRLAPQIRLLFAGLLTMLLGMLFALELIELSIGAVSLTDITTSPLLAFIVGAFCGISELALPVSINNRATTFMQNVK